MVRPGAPPALPNATAPTQHLLALDGLRGFAAVWVLFGHVFQQTGLGSPLLWLPLHNGYAVDLFMMLSGFLMFRLHGEFADRRAVTFWLRRLFRLAPLYFTCLLFACLLASRFLFARHVIAAFNGFDFSTWPILTDWRSALAHLTFTFGLSPRLSQSTAMPDWSLSLEMQFYLVFPALILLIRRIGAGLAVVGLVTIQLLALMAFAPYFQAFRFPSPLPLELNLFLAGMAIAMPGRRQIPLGMLLAVAMSTSLTDVAIRASLALLLAAGAHAPFHPALRRLAKWMRRPFELPVVRWLGAISYPIYLTHVLVLFLTLGALLQIGVHEKRLLGAITLALTLAITIGVSQLLHWAVELPGMKLGRLAVAAVSRPGRGAGAQATAPP